MHTKIQRIWACSKQQPLESCGKSWMEKLWTRTPFVEKLIHFWRLQVSCGFDFAFASTTVVVVPVEMLAVPETEPPKRKRETLLSSHGKARRFLSRLDDWTGGRLNLGNLTRNLTRQVTPSITLVVPLRHRRCKRRGPAGATVSCKSRGWMFARWLELSQILWDVRPGAKFACSKSGDMAFLKYIGGPRFSSSIWMGFSLTKTIHFWVPPWLWKPPCRDWLLRSSKSLSCQIGDGTVIKGIDEALGMFSALLARRSAVVHVASPRDFEECEKVAYVNSTFPCRTWLNSLCSIEVSRSLKTNYCWIRR